MKTRIYVAGTFAALALFTACGKDPQNTVDPWVEVERDGVLWQATEEISASLNANTDELIVEGEDASNNNRVEIQIQNVTGPGTITLPDTVDDQTYIRVVKNNLVYRIDKYTSSHGTITITEVEAGTGNVKGTFQGTAYTFSETDSVVLTNGSFGSF